jgi:NAD(P)-dependent dehydrogenase (short-subunit alcohol dehydrogenase family)
VLSRVTATAASMSISADCVTCRAYYTFLCHRNHLSRSSDRAMGLRSLYVSSPSLRVCGRPLGGLLPAHAFGAVPFTVWKRTIEAKLTGSFFLFKAVLPRMMAQQ